MTDISDMTPEEVAIADDLKKAGQRSVSMLREYAGGQESPRFFPTG